MQSNNHSQKFIFPNFPIVIKPNYFKIQAYSQQNTLLNDYPAKMSLVLFDRFGGGFSAIL